MGERELLLFGVNTEPILNVADFWFSNSKCAWSDKLLRHRVYNPCIPVGVALGTSARGHGIQSGSSQYH